MRLPLPPAEYVRALMTGTALLLVVLLASPASAATTRVEETDTTRVSVSGAWSSVSHASNSGGAALRAAVASGAGDVNRYVQITAAVAGSISWGYVAQSTGAIGIVTVNGVEVARVDTKAATTTYQVVAGPWSVAAGDVLRVTHGGASSGTSTSYLWLDFFDLTDEPAAEPTTEPAPTTDTTAPAQPTGLTATAGDASVSLAWNANTETDLAGYRVWRDGALLGEPATAGWTDTTVVNGTTYSYEVAALDTAGNVSAKAGPVTATPAAPTTSDPPPDTSTSVQDVRLVGASEVAYGPVLSVMAVGQGLSVLVLMGLLVAQLKGR